MVGSGRGGCEPKIEIIVKIQNKKFGVRVDVKPRSGSNCENAEKSRAWGHGGCEPRIEVIVKL